MLRIPRLFQFTHPVRGATIFCPPLSDAKVVSIHAPRAGCDRVFARLTPVPLRFNSRTPCGVRLLSSSITSVSKGFQFTHPVRGATQEM